MFTANRFSSTLPTERLCATAGELPIMGKTLAEMQDWAVKLNKGEWSDSTAQLWIREDVHVSHQAIELFLAAVVGKEGDFQWRAEGAAGNFVEEIAFSDSVPMMVWCSNPCEENIDRFTQAEVLTVDVKTHPIAIPAPQQEMGVQLVSLPLTDAVVIPLGHWSQTLWGNLLSLGPYLWRELVGENIFSMFFRLGSAALFSLSTNPKKLIRGFVRKGKNCFIHPTAVVEACILGDNVRIGANAVVRGSILRDGVQVEDLALVEGSVLSAGALVQRQAMVKYAVLDESAAAAGVVQLSLMGVQSSVKRGAYLMDVNFSGAVQVLYNDKAHTAPLGLIGCGVGEHAVVGLGVAIAAGRWLPTKTKTIMNPQNMLLRTKVTDAEEDRGVYAVVEGSLRRVDAQ